jgi:hypothetical protein
VKKTTEKKLKKQRLTKEFIGAFLRYVPGTRQGNVIKDVLNINISKNKGIINTKKKYRKNKIKTRRMIRK